MSSGLTQEKLAERADVSLRYIQQLERGDRNPRVPTIVRLIKGLRCSYNDLFQNL